MTNIWGFVIQTVQVSFVALILLFLKEIMKDKLPPLWHYSIWSAFAVALVVPAGLGGKFLLRKPVAYIQAVKTLTESNFNSFYTNREDLVYNTSIVPLIKSAPQSLTDFIFIIYVFGVIFCLLRYIIGYFKLSAVISKASGDEGLQRQVNAVSAKYKLKARPVKAVDGLSTAFVFGIFRPVMMLPRDKYTDDKVILHELLHLRYKDLWMKVIRSFFRALHWPNPLVQYVFKLINNDMESLCDSRVLKRLEGEERRDYGRILLSMTNEKYPSAFGTTSISNGTAFIKHRIETIARFKKYPKGMELVAGCIIILLLPLAVKGGEQPKEVNGTDMLRFDDFKNQLILEERKMISCPTIAGALDVYRKNVMFNRDKDYMYDLLPVKPMGMEIETYELHDEMHPVEYNPFYAVLGLEKIDKDNYTAKIMGKSEKVDGQYGAGTEYIAIPVNILRQNGGWKVYQSGDYKSYILEGVMDYTNGVPKTEDYDGGKQYIYSCNRGEIKFVAEGVCTVYDESGNMVARPDREFNSIYNDVNIVYTPSDIAKNKRILTTRVAKFTGDNSPEDLEIMYRYNGQEMSVSSDDGQINTMPVEKLFDSAGGKMEISISYPADSIEDLKNLPVLYMELWYDGECAENFTINLNTGEIIETDL